MEKFNRIVSSCLKNDISDLHISSDHPVVVRKNGQLFFQKEISFSNAELEKLLSTVLKDRQRQILTQRWSVDFALHTQETQMRVNAFYTTRGLSLAIRFLPSLIPCFEDLNLLPSLRELAGLKHGLILVCGPTSNGKTTTIAALVDEINRTRSVHVITLEDPVEYRFPPLKSMIEQRELGTHFHNFEQGLLDILREDADVIVVGELREPETVRLTLSAAESGHLVIATLHAGTTEEALLRIFNSFPPEAQEFVRVQLSSSLAAVLVQHLEFVEKAGFRVPILSIARGSAPLKNLIRDNRLNQLDNMMHMSRNDGMYTFDRYREEILAKAGGLIPPARAFRPKPLQPGAVQTTGLIQSPSAPSAPQTQPCEPAAPVQPQPVYVPQGTPGGPTASPGPASSPASGDVEARDVYEIEEDASLEELIKQFGGPAKG